MLLSTRLRTASNAAGARNRLDRKLASTTPAKSVPVRYPLLAAVLQMSCRHSSRRSTPVASDSNARFQRPLRRDTLVSCPEDTSLDPKPHVSLRTLTRCLALRRVRGRRLASLPTVGTATDRSRGWVVWVPVGREHPRDSFVRSIVVSPVRTCRRFGSNLPWDATSRGRDSESPE